MLPPLSTIGLLCEQERKRGELKQVWLVLGETDPIIVAEELVEDAEQVLGRENVRVKLVKGVGHEVGVERADKIVDAVGSILGLGKRW